MVPNILQVVQGAKVLIVLKADQRNGRQVQGVVQDILTRGNHPRGIKVRLADGRIGRVQQMDAGGAGAREQDFAPIVSQETAELQVSTEGQQPTPSHRRYRFQSSDVRLDGPLEEPPAQYDLATFIKQTKPKSKRANTRSELPSNPTPDAGPTIASCPLCGVFEGDEAAVTHHVESHFT